MSNFKFKKKFEIKKNRFTKPIKISNSLLNFTDDSFDDSMTTTEAPGLGYNVEVKLVQLGENYKAPTKGSVQYDDLSNSITENFKPVFDKLTGFRRINVEDIRP